VTGLLPHLLRPGWLLLLPLLALLWYRLRREPPGKEEAAAPLAPHLRRALTIPPGNPGRLRPLDFLALLALLLLSAAAGPAWQRQESPWFEDRAPLLLALEVSDSMRSNDLLPSRLERARFKILDLLAARAGSRSALIAYAGTAHIVVPPSSDVAVLGPFLESLDPAVMPRPGENASAVLDQARMLLESEEGGARGTLLFINDGFAAVDLPALRAFAAEPGAPVIAALVLGSAEGGVAWQEDGRRAKSAAGETLDTRIDEELLRRAQNEAGIEVLRFSNDDRDIRALLRIIESARHADEDADIAWRDDGWWLLWPAVLLALLWFRRGWTVEG